MRPSTGSLTSERIALIHWAARHGAVTEEALAERTGSALISARARLAAAERDGLLRSARVLGGAAALYTATSAGLRVADARSLGACRVSASNAAHLATSAWVAAVLEHRYPDHTVRSERELRRDERESSAPLASARLSALQGARSHRPDLVLWPPRTTGLPVAIEVELTVKAPVRLEQICRAWARARCVAGVVYIAAPDVELALERAIARARAAERVVVVPLAALRGSDELDPRLGGGGRSREPSQARRTVSGGGSNS
jgi:hypothetical protein